MLQVQFDKVRAFLFAVCATALVQTAAAGPASPQPVQAVQPNGTTFQAFMRGDEFQGWMETAEGFTVLKNRATGYFEYAEQNASGSLVPSGIKAAVEGAASAKKGLRPLTHAALAEYQKQLLDTVLARRMQGGARTPAPVTGALKVLTILVDFQDAGLSPGASSYWGNAVYSPTGISANKYFQDNSFGAVSIAPVKHTQPSSPAGVVSVSLTQNHPDCGSTCSYPMESAWVKSALAAAATYVDFAALDANADGNIGVDEALIYFVVAGYEASANAALAPNVWSHAWGGEGVSVAGKGVKHWALSGEMYDSVSRMGMGVIAHELGHLGGLPDLYDTSFTNAGLGGFSLMATGSWGRKTGDIPGTTPVALDALSRQYMGWSSPQSPVDGATVSFVSGLVSPSSAVLLMNSALSNSEYWLVENRPPVGWDVGLQDFLGAWSGGLLIQHIDLSAGFGTLGNFNTYVQGGHQGAMVVEPAAATCSLVNPYTSSRGCASILFHSTGSPAFDGETIPGTNYYSGVGSGLGLSGISAPGSVMFARVNRKFGDNLPAAVSAASNRRIAIGGSAGIDGSNQSTLTLLGKVTASNVPGSVNVASATAGGVASASSTYPGYPVTRVNDNERTGGASMSLTWFDNTPNAFPDWVQINFSGAKQIDRIVLYTVQDAYASPVEPSDTLTFSKIGNTGYTVQTWDGAGWVTQATITGNNLVKRTVMFPAVTTDRIRINVTSTVQGISYITEIEAWTPSSTSINAASVSQGGVASASSTYPGYPVTRVNDNERTGGASMSLMWFDNTPNTFPDWVQINFSGAKQIDRVVLYTVQDAYASPVEPTDTLTFSQVGNTGYTVQTWDGSSWITQATITGNNLVKRTVMFPAVNTDRIRVNVTSSVQGYASYVAEVEAWTVVAGTPPSAPMIGAAVAGNASASVAFAPGALGSGTLVNYTADCGGITATGASSPVTVTGLANGTSYNCKVKTTSTVGTSPWSALSNAVTPANAGTPPAAPTIGTASAGNASASVAFTPGALGSGTLVNYTADCGGITATGSASPVTVTGLANGTSYTCKVKTTSSVGTSAWSALSNAVTPANAGTPPSAPSIGTAIALDASISVNFTPGAQGTGTLVNYTVDCGGITASATYAPITVTGLTNGTSYTCKARTTTGAGSSPWSGVSNSVIPAVIVGSGTLPSAPTIDSASAGSASVSVAFTPGSLGNSTFVSFTADCNGIIANGMGSPINVMGLSNGTTYNCKVKAVSVLGASPWSALSNTVTPAASVTQPSAPTIGTATAGNASANVAFTPGNLGSGALVNHTAVCGAFATNGASSPINVTGLTNGTSYFCKVRTTTTAGVSAWSANANAVVPEVAEPAVTYFHNDISGSPMLATDGAGAVIWKENYRPYGERLNNQAGSNKNKLGFAGKQFDPATGLSYMGARYYDPVLGRFMGVDPVDYQEDNIHSFNRFAYANNNPYKYVDPNGRHPVLAAIGFLATRAMLWLAERQAVAIMAAETTAAVATGAVVPSVALEGAAAKAVAKEITLSRAAHGEAAVHAGDAIKAGQPSVLTIERTGSTANRSQSIGGLEKVPGKHLDEYPPAMFKEGGKGASVRAINPRDNMSAGACIGNACRSLPDGAQVRIKVTD